MATKKSLTTAKEPQKTQETKREFTLKEFFALWRNEPKDQAKPVYFTGKITSEEYEFSKLIAFQNGKKKNPKEPDLRVYLVNEAGERVKEEFVSLWINATENGKKYFSGKFGDERLVGFISDTTENKRPAIRVYFSDDKAEN